jgi:nucleoside-triphosphatase
VAALRPVVPANVFVTGPPGSGKTTAVERARERLADRGYAAAGVRAPEVREGGERVGFDIVSLRTGRRAAMARIDRDAGPGVGKYRVDVRAVDRLVADALDTAGVDYLLLDEIGPMQVRSDTFVRRVRAALDAETPVLATVKADSRPDGDRDPTDFIEAVHDRDDGLRVTVTPAERDALPERLAAAVAARCGGD